MRDRWLDAVPASSKGGLAPRTAHGLGKDLGGLLVLEPRGAARSLDRAPLASIPASGTPGCNATAPLTCRDLGAGTPRARREPFQLSDGTFPRLPARALVPLPFSRLARTVRAWQRACLRLTQTPLAGAQARGQASSKESAPLHPLPQRRTAARLRPVGVTPQRRPPARRPQAFVAPLSFFGHQRKRPWKALWPNQNP